MKDREEFPIDQPVEAWALSTRTEGAKGAKPSNRLDKREQFADFISMLLLRGPEASVSFGCLACTSEPVAGCKTCIDN